MDTMHELRCVDLAGVDWAGAWEDHYARRAKPADASAWDRRARGYTDRRLSDYESAFLGMLDVREGDVVLDFGCGPGILAVPLAQRGCRVIAADFSDGMLAEARRAAEEAGVADLVECRKVAWDDDWEAAGLLPGSVDVAVASRSMATRHMADALFKLDRTARRQVVVSLAAGHSPRRDERAFAAVGRARPWVSDYAYCMNILFERGVYPELAYIVSYSRPAFADRAETVAEMTRMIVSESGELSGEELAALEAFVDAHYGHDAQADPSRRWKSDEPRDLRWACISWRAGQGD